MRWRVRAQHWQHVCRSCGLLQERREPCSTVLAGSHCLQLEVEKGQQACWMRRVGRFLCPQEVISLLLLQMGLMPALRPSHPLTVIFLSVCGLVGLGCVPVYVFTLFLYVLASLSLNLSLIQLSHLFLVSFSVSYVLFAIPCKTRRSIHLVAVSA